MHAFAERGDPLIADIGGGIGTQLIDILNAHPSCRGILFDLPGTLDPRRFLLQRPFRPQTRICCAG